MKLLNYHFPLYLFTFTMTLFSLSSCSSDDDMKNNVEGAFTITNISSGKVMNASSNKMFDKDTLRIMFQPKEEHKDLQFTIDCEELKSIGDNLYILKSNTLSPNSLKVTAKCESGNTQYCAETKIGINISHSYAVIPFCVQASQDLLLLSSAQVTYTDADGQEHSFGINDEEWVRPDSINLYLFRDNNGNEQLINDKSEGEEKGWTLIEEEKLGPNATFTFDVRYYHLGIDASVSVTYKRKEHVTATADTYYLLHRIDRKSADITVSNGIVVDIYNPTNIDLTDHNIPNTELENYFIKLQSNPDIFKLNISNTGSITQIK